MPYRNISQLAVPTSIALRSLSVTASQNLKANGFGSLFDDVDKTDKSLWLNTFYWGTVYPDKLLNCTVAPMLVVLTMSMDRFMDVREIELNYQNVSRIDTFPHAFAKIIANSGTLYIADSENGKRIRVELPADVATFSIYANNSSLLSRESPDIDSTIRTYIKDFVSYMVSNVDIAKI